MVVVELALEKNSFLLLVFSSRIQLIEFNCCDTFISCLNLNKEYLTVRLMKSVLYNILHPNGLSSNLNESAASTATKRRLWEHRPRFCTTLLDRCFRLDPCTLAECWLQEVQCSSSPAHT